MPIENVAEQRAEFACVVLHESTAGGSIDIVKRCRFVLLDPNNPGERHNRHANSGYF